MKVCSYCGRENEEDALCCSGCGTPFSSTERFGTDASQPPSLPPPVPTFTQPPAIPLSAQGLRAWPATVVLLVLLAVQFAAGILIALVAMVAVAIQGKNITFPKATTELTSAMMPYALFIATVASGIAMFFTSRALLGKNLRDTSPIGAAWVRGPLRRIIQGLVTGLLLGLLYVLGATLIGGDWSQTDLGPVTRMAMTPGLPRILWLVMALLLAPPVEEMLFRGVLYGGFRRSFGAVKAAVLTTVVFVILHYAEAMHFWLASVAISAFAIAALYFRVRSAAVGPAIAVHFGYNLVIAGTLFATPAR